MFFFFFLKTIDPVLWTKIRKTCGRFRRRRVANIDNVQIIEEILKDHLYIERISDPLLWGMQEHISRGKRLDQILRKRLSGNTKTQWKGDAGNSMKISDRFSMRKKE